MKSFAPVMATIAISFLLLSCNTSENNKLIIGNWTGAAWLINGQPSNNNALETHFIFDDKGKYIYDYAGNKEEGTYKVENEMLFTKPANQQEIMVKIMTLTKDSLIFDMNRSGQQETLILLKK